MAAFTLGLPPAPSVGAWGAARMQIVNGYLCMNCCDIDKARLGQDPHQSTNQIQKQIEQKLDKLTPPKFGPAVTFGGSLQATSADGAYDPSGGPQPSPDANGPVSTTSVDLVV
jgi:hypothetical protein